MYKLFSSQITEQAISFPLFGEQFLKTLPAPAPRSTPMRHLPTKQVLLVSPKIVDLSMSNKYEFSFDFRSRMGYQIACTRLRDSSLVPSPKMPVFCIQTT